MPAATLSPPDGRLQLTLYSCRPPLESYCLLFTRLSLIGRLGSLSTPESLMGDGDRYAGPLLWSSRYTSRVESTVTRFHVTAAVPQRPACLSEWCETLSANYGLLLSATVVSSSLSSRPQELEARYTYRELCNWTRISLVWCQRAMEFYTRTSVPCA